MNFYVIFQTDFFRPFLRYFYGQKVVKWGTLFIDCLHSWKVCVESCQLQMQGHGLLALSFPSRVGSNENCQICALPWMLAFSSQNKGSSFCTRPHCPDHRQVVNQHRQVGRQVGRYKMMESATVPNYTFYEHLRTC